MNPQAWWTLLITLAAALLLISERVRADLLALIVLVVLGLSGLVQPHEAFAGFSGSAVITILAISMISEGLHKTGVTHKLGRLMQRLGGQKPLRLLLVTMLASAALSLFMNNIAAVGVLLPAVASLSRQTRQPPARLLMPLAFGTLLGGMATLLTTSNIIVSGALRDAHFKPFGLLDFLPVGLPIVVVGVGYMLLVGRRLLPRQPASDTAWGQRLRVELANLYGIQKNLCNVLVLKGSPLAGQSLQAGRWYQRLELSVIGLVRGGHAHMAPPRTELVQVGDVILAQGLPEKKQLDKFGLRLLDTPRQPSPVTDAGVVLAEVMLAPHAALVGKSLRQIHFRRKYNFNVLAIWRAGQSQQAELADLPLQLGDVLLVQGPAAGLSVLRAERDFIVLEEDPDPVFAPGKARHALIITLGVLGVASLGWLPVAQVSLLGAVLMVLSGCLSLEDAYGAIEWKAIFLIAGMWPLSTAISSSGLADGLVQALLATFGRLPPLALAGILLLVTTLLTQFMGGQVASLVLAPLAISAAAALGADARGLGMAVALGCSLAFLTPFGHPVNIMVMGPGGYSFRDFLRVGAPLTLLEAAVILLGLHFFWGI